MIHNPDTPTQLILISAHESTGVTGQPQDLRVCQALGVHAAPVCTALTAQERDNKTSRIAPVTPDHLIAQLEAAWQTQPAAIKIGLVPTLEQAEVLARWLERHPIPVVLDPIMISSLRHPLTLDDPVKITETLLPYVTLITPNQSEAHQLEQRLSSDNFQGAWLITGGDANETQLTDALHIDQQTWAFHTLRINTPNSRGTGCTLSTAIACGLALGYSLTDAITLGKMLTHEALEQAQSAGLVSGHPLPVGMPSKSSSLPKITHASDTALEGTFPSMEKPIGLYPVVDSADWVERLASTGITTIQLRIKSSDQAFLRAEISKAIEIGQRHQLQLFINDHWQLAIELRAYGVHLGHEDLDTADLQALQAAGIRLGLSTHCLFEFARAASVNPSYLATGPVFSTTSKVMPWRPQGIRGLRYWHSLSPCPLVAIGGIGRPNIERVAETGVEGIAMISAITESANPEQETLELINMMTATPIASPA